METFLEMYSELQERLLVSSSSTIYNIDRCKKLIQQAHLWATALYPFRELTDPLYTSTDGSDLYDYPEEYRSNSIWLIYIDGKPYRKKQLEDFLEYRRKNPNSTKRIFADLPRQYLVFPKPASGKTLDVYGQLQANQIVNNTDKTIFSNSNTEGNEAIIMKAESVAKKDLDLKNQAIEILTKIYSEQKDNSQFEQTLDKPFFNVPDFFGGGINNLSTWGNVDEDE